MAVYSKIIDERYIYLPKAELKDIRRLKQMLTVVPKFDNRSAVECFVEKGEWFGVPRHFANFKNKTETYIDKRVDGLPVDFEMRHSFRDRQVPLFNQFKKHIDSGTTGVILVAPTGTGKTFLLLSFIQYLKRTALVVVPREYIIEQWVERILEHTTLKMKDIGIVQQNRCGYEGKKIVIGMIHSLSKDKYTEQFKKYFGIVAYDECHVVPAETFSRTAGMFPARYRIGASATPKRQDGMDAVFSMHVGEVTIRDRGLTDVVPSVLMREYATKDKPPKLAYLSDRLQRRGVIISALASDLRRNMLIASYLAKLFKSGRKTLMLTDRKDQVFDIRAILMSRFSVDPKDIGIFIQETPKNERKKVLEESGIILATYGMMSMAVDVPDIAGLVFGTPQSQVTQSVGRILRKCAGKKNPVVVDIVDIGFKETVRWAIKRKKQYIEGGASIVTSKDG